MPFPLTGLLDKFNRADASPATGWAEFAGVGSAGGIQTVSNQAKASVALNFVSSRYTAATYGDVVEAYLKIISLGGLVVAVFLRIQNEGATTTDGYYVEHIGDAATDIVRFWRLDNAAYTQLGADSLVEADTWFGARHDGTTLTIYTGNANFDFTAQFTRTDSTYVGTGAIGVGLFSNAGNTAPIIDDFGGGSAIRAPQPRPIRPAAFTPGSAR